jgi:hypothetical protein
MSDPHASELHELERATSIAPVAPAELDPETAQLREGWLRLTQLLDAADEAWDSQAFAHQIELPKPALWQRPLALCGALAASLLVCALAAWLHSARTNDPTTLRNTSVAQVEPPEQPQASEVTAPANSTMSHEELAWDDTLDERLTNLHGALATVRGSSFMNDSRMSVLSTQLRQIATEIEAGSL